MLTALEVLSLEPAGHALFRGGAEHLPALRELSISAARDRDDDGITSSSLTRLSLLGIRVRPLSAVHSPADACTAEAPVKSTWYCS